MSNFSLPIIEISSACIQNKSRDKFWVIIQNKKVVMLMTTQLFLRSFVVGHNLQCHGRVVRSIKFKFWWSSHQRVGSYPGCDTCVLEQVLYYNCFLSPRSINGYPREILCMKKPLEHYSCPGCILLRELRKIIEI